MSCLSEDEVLGLVHGALAPESAARAHAHLDGCATCRRLVSALLIETALETSTDEDPGVEIAPGTRIGRYRVDQPIGIGGMGAVYLAVDPSLDRPVAIKVLVDRASRAPGHRLRLERESRALAQVSHPNVVTIYEVGEHLGRTYLAMEYVEGGTLADWLAADRRSIADILELVRQIGAGLASVHRAGLVHRDIKPDNLLVGADGRARISDFGLVQIATGSPTPSGEAGVLRDHGEKVSSLSDRLTVTGTVLGTPRYMAPEVIRAAEADARSDQWSFCATVWEALFGAPAYPGDVAAMLVRADADVEPEVPARGRRVPSWVRRALRQGLERDPARRWASMEELVRALEPRRTRWALIAAGALAAGAAAAGLAVGTGIERRAEGDPCAGVESSLDGVWDPTRRAEVARALDAPAISSGARTAAATVERLLEAYARSWLDSRRKACHAMQTDGGDRPGLGGLWTACLDRRKRILAAMVGELSRGATPDLNLAVAGIESLPPASECAQPEWLARRQALPVSSEKRARIERVMDRLDTAWAQLRIGRVRSAQASAPAILAEARSIADGPLEAAALRLAGQVARMKAEGTAADTLYQALWAAERAGDDVLAAELWSDIVAASSMTTMTAAEESRMLQHADAAVARLEHLAPEAYRRTRAGVLRAQGVLLTTRGRPAEAEPILRAALALELEVRGPTSMGAARARRVLGGTLLQRGAYQEAADLLAESLRQTERLLGSDNPELQAEYYQIGWALHLLGKDDEALVHVARARAVAESREGGPSASMALVLDLEANIRGGRGELEIAAGLLLEAIDLVEGTWPADQIAALRNSLAMIRLEAGEVAAAEALFRDSVAVYQAMGSRTAELDVARVGLAECLVKRGKDRAASAVLVPAVRSIEAREGDPGLAGRAHFLLARATWPRQGARSIRLARQAASELARVPGKQGLRMRAEVEAWLALRVSPAEPDRRATKR